jgi:hypothetical protein
MKIFILVTYVEIIRINLFGTKDNVLCVSDRKLYGLVPGKIKDFFPSEKSIQTLGPSQPPI